jgi:hypothetical protein
MESATVQDAFVSCDNTSRMTRIGICFTWLA